MRGILFGSPFSVEVLAKCVCVCEIEFLSWVVLFLTHFCSYSCSPWLTAVPAAAAEPAEEGIS